MRLFKIKYIFSLLAVAAFAFMLSCDGITIEDIEGEGGDNKEFIYGAITAAGECPIGSDCADSRGQCHCYPDKSDCQKYCMNQFTVASVVVRGGRICGSDWSCIPGDLKKLRLILEVRKLELAEVRVANIQDAAYAKGVVKDFDEKNGLATFGFEIVDEKLAGEELFIYAKGNYFDKNGELVENLLAAGPIPEGRFK